MPPQCLPEEAYRRVPDDGRYFGAGAPPRVPSTKRDVETKSTEKSQRQSSRPKASEHEDDEGNLALRVQITGDEGSEEEGDKQACRINSRRPEVDLEVYSMQYKDRERPHPERRSLRRSRSRSHDRDAFSKPLSSRR